MVLDAMKSQAETYARKFDGEPYLDHREINETLDGRKASTEEVYEAADALMDFYDELLGRDTEEVREDFRDDILYDMSVGEMLTPGADRQTAKIFGSGLAAPIAAAAIEPSMAPEALGFSALVCEFYNTRATLSNAEAGYNPYSGKIGVSTGELPGRQAHDTLASELFHKYQHEFDSPSWMDLRREEEIPHVREGLERASKIKALEAFAEEDFQEMDWEQLHDMRVASTAVNGYAQALSENSQVKEQDMREIGLTDEKAVEAVENVGSEESKVYDKVAASLLAQEQVSGPEVYREVFENGPGSVPDPALS